MTRAPRRIGFALSLLVHGGALATVWVWQQQGAAPTAKGAPVVPVSLTMFATERPVVAQQPLTARPAVAPAEPPPAEPAPPTEPPATVTPRQPKRPEPPLVRPPSSQPQSRPQHRPATPPVTAPPPEVAPEAALTAAPEPVATAAPRVSLAELRDSYQAQLLAAIERQKFYPARARRRGLQGQVQVRFRILADGRVEAIALAESCGNALLDRAALNTVKRLGRVPPLPLALGLDQWELVVPLDYRLL